MLEELWITHRDFEIQIVEIQEPKGLDEPKDHKNFRIQQVIDCWSRYSDISSENGVETIVIQENDKEVGESISEE